MNKILRFTLALTDAVIKSIRIEDDSIVVGVRPYKLRQRRCPACGRICEAYDGREKPRRWRALDLGASKCYLEYAPARVACPKHGVHVESVPWARPRSRFTRPFEDMVQACRIEWHGVSGICERVFDDLANSSLR